MRSEDDAGVIDRPCLRLPLLGKQVAYAPSVHSEAKLDCIYVNVSSWKKSLINEITVNSHPYRKK